MRPIRVARYAWNLMRLGILAGAVLGVVHLKGDGWFTRLVAGAVAGYGLGCIAAIVLMPFERWMPKSWLERV